MQWLLSHTTNSSQWMICFTNRYWPWGAFINEMPPPGIRMVLFFLTILHVPLYLPVPCVLILPQITTPTMFSSWQLMPRRGGSIKAVSRRTSCLCVHLMLCVPSDPNRMNLLPSLKSTFVNNLLSNSNAPSQVEI